MAETIVDKNLLEQYKEDMQAYSIITNRRRAIPDIRDGLKLSQRRVIETMYYHLNCETNFTKVSNVTGRMMAELHPHSAADDTLVGMTQDFSNTVTLIEGQGNFGSISGKPAAASRYIEARLSKFSREAIIAEMKENRNVVDLIPNYLGTCLEPEYFPVKVPLLLINGTAGIGLGLISAVPKHNLAEVIDATINLMKHPNASVVLVPDPPMPCEIIDTDWKKICNTGNGKYKSRGIIDIEEYKGRQALVIKSTPDYVFLDSVTDKIEELIDKNVIIGITDMQAEHYKDKATGNEVMRFVIVLKKGSDPYFVRDLIYKHTPMETTHSVNFEALQGIDLVRFSYKSYLQYFIDFRRVTKFRLYCNRLQAVQTKFHEKEAYIKVLESGEMDNIISMIRKSDRSDADLIEYLVKKLNITDLQAAFIINSNLKNLSKRYLNKYKEEAANYSKLSEEYLEKITNDDFDEEIISELQYFKQKYGRPRRSRLITQADANNIPNGEFKVIITENNFIKKVHINDSIGSFRGDVPKYILKVENINNILIFDEFGKVFKLPVHKIPFTDKSSAGTDIRLLIKNLTSDIRTIMYENVIEELSKSTSKHFLNVVTKMGNIKKLDLEDFLAVPPSGIIYIKLEPGDSIQDLEIIHYSLDVVVYSDTHLLRIKSSSVPHLKRNAKGVKSIGLDNGQYVDGLSVIYPNATHIVIITEEGMVNKFDAVALPTLSRGKKGTKIKLKARDKIHSVFGVNDDNVLRVVTKNQKYEFPIKDIESMTSVSLGTKLIPTKGDNILKCSILLKGEE